MRQFMWLARSRPILLLLLAWGISYAGDMAAYTVASVYLYRAGGAGYVGLLGVEWALSAALLVPLVSSWSDRVRRERRSVSALSEGPTTAPAEPKPLSPEDAVFKKAVELLKTPAKKAA